SQTRLNQPGVKVNNTAYVCDFSLPNKIVVSNTTNQGFNWSEVSDGCKIHYDYTTVAPLAKDVFSQRRISEIGRESLSRLYILVNEKSKVEEIQFVVPRSTKIYAEELLALENELKKLTFPDYDEQVVLLEELGCEINGYLLVTFTLIVNKLNE
ncbi:MAG: hypothetical protein AAF734_13135, partial [Bacteroidota bacterium]